MYKSVLLDEIPTCFETEVENTDKYAFECGYLRDSLYQIMLFKQRRLMHNAYADIFEE